MRMGLIQFNIRFNTAVALLLLLCCVNSFSQNQNPSSAKKSIKEIEQAEFSEYLSILLLRKDSNYLFLQHEIRNIYKHNNLTSIWFDDYELQPIAKQLIDTLSQSHFYGLHPDFYPTKIIKAQLTKLQKLNSRSQKLYTKARIELLITLATLEFITHLKFGIVRGKVIWSSEKESYLRNKVMAGFYQLADNQPLARTITNLQPTSYYYKKLSAALKKFSLPDVNNWPEAETIYTMNNRLKKDILTILQLTGFFTGNVEQAISQFSLIINSYQAYYKIPESTFVGPATRDHILTHIFTQFKIMAVNIERLRQNPPLSKSFFWVNIPAYKLSIFENLQLTKTIRVIVGSPQTPTPVLSGYLSHVITYPKWNIPPSIVSRDIIPAIKRDSLYLTRKGYYITDWDGEVLDQSTTNIDSYTNTYFPFNITQDPGPSNALGTMKFLFDNDLSIYLHDTNARYLFAKKKRAYSHGCIRVENPENLARYILSDKEISRMEKQMRNKQSGYLFVDKTVGIYIRYITCEANSNGDVTYFKDIYSLDEKEWQQMLNCLLVSSTPIEDW